MLFRRKWLLIMAAAMLAILCAGTAVFADEKALISDDPAGDSTVITQEMLEESALAVSCKAVQRVNLPNINSGEDPVLMNDGWSVTTDFDALLIIYYMGGIPTIYRNDVALSPRDYFTVDTGNGKVYIRTYQLRKGDRCLLSKSSSEDYVAGNYARCGGTLSSGKALVAASAGDTVTSYFKVKATGNGIIKLNVRGDFNDNSLYKVKLFNSKKKALSKGWETLYSSNSYTTVFGVRKGTYYVGVRPYSGSSDGIFDIKATFSKKSVSPAGTSKKKARKIKLGQNRQGILYIAEKKSYWYKFKMKKKGRIRVIASSQEGPGGSGSDQIRYVISGPGIIALGNSTYKVQKGTFYMKIYHKKNATGFYKFKIKKV